MSLRVLPRGGRPSGLVLLAVALLLAARPPVARAQSDAQLIARGKAEAETIWRRGFTLGDLQLDAGLQARLDSLSRHLVANPDVRLQARVFRSPDPNAFALPDGSIFVFAGLLAELKTWDQVRFILAHEAQHAVNSHARKFMAQGKTKIALWEIVSLGVSIGLGTSGMSGAALVNSFSQLGLALAASAAVHGYGRGLEEEADREGAHALLAAGCDSCAPLQALRALEKDADRHGRLSNFFWGSHPLLQDRIGELAQRSPSHCGDVDSLAALAYLPTRRAMTGLTARLWLDQHKPARALEACNAYLALAPGDSTAHCLLGEAYLASGAQDTLGLAVAAFRQALGSSGGGYREPHLGLALAVEKQGDTLAAIPHLERYLAGDARVPNRRMYVRKLKALKLRLAPALPDSLVIPGHAAPDSLKEDQP